MAQPASSGRELLVLGVLGEGPSSAYALARAVKMHGTLYGSLSRGNLYEYLVTLERDGTVTSEQGNATRGPRTTKKIYTLSTRGRRRFQTVLAAALADPQADDGLVEVACVLLKAVPLERARELMAKRIAALIAHEKRLPRLFGHPKRGSGAALALSHAQAKIRAEITWTKATSLSLPTRYSASRASRSSR